MRLTAYASSLTGDEYGHLDSARIGRLVGPHPNDDPEHNLEWYRVESVDGRREDGADLFVSTRELGKLLFPARRAA